MAHTYEEIMGESGIDRIRQDHKGLGKKRTVDADNPDYVAAKAENGTPRITVVPYTPPTPEPLSVLKTRKVADIEAKSRVLIGAGFDHSNKTFGMTEIDQQRWAEMGVALALDLLTFPMKVSDQEHKTLTLANADAAKAFLASYLQRRETEVLVPGRDLKDQIANAANEAALDAIVDNRS